MPPEAARRAPRAPSPAASSSARLGLLFARPPRPPSSSEPNHERIKDYLNALKEDLRDRRMLPLVVLAGVAMLGAIAFVVLGGWLGELPATPTAALRIARRAAKPTASRSRR